MTNVFTVHRTVCVMKCVPLEECGGARNYVGHYHIVTIDHSRHEPSNVQNAPKPPPKMRNLLKRGQNSVFTRLTFPMLTHQETVNGHSDRFRYEQYFQQLQELGTGTTFQYIVNS